MKISLLLPDLRGGGAEKVQLTLAREFKRAGHGVSLVVLRARGELLPEATEHFEVVDLEAGRVRKAIRPLAEYLRRVQPDALVSAMWPLTVIAPLATRLARVPCRTLVSEHGILSAQYAAWGFMHRQLLRLSTRVGYRLADARVGVSRGVASDMAALAGLAADRVEVIYNPLSSPGPGDRVRDERDAGWTVGRGARVLTVGSLKAVKNHRLLLQAFAELRLPDSELIIVGGGDLEIDLRRFAAELGVDRAVRFAGYRVDPGPFYRTADIFVLPSDREGQSLVIVEALSCGLPVVATDCPTGPREVLEDGRYGCLTPPGDASALARAMRKSLAEPPSVADLRRRAADFAPDLAARRYLDLLEQQ